ncbi:hypothetical protein [Synechococcus sp. UW140]|uniref:hypothetical protein n=1 Tax=Synechococcus sp. UW140 TaxID=368503 RepID=UPI001FCB3BDE|nr:hypothetical protein [Synechococcus sp. UW140]
MTIAKKARMGHWASASLATALMLAGSSASPGSSATPSPPKPTASTPAQVHLADQLKDAGVKYYGSWRCPACQYQSNLFGQRGQERLPYVECAKPDTLPEQAKACIAAEIRAYPTWIHPSGERRVGVQSLNELQGWIEQP